MKRSVIFLAGFLIVFGIVIATNYSSIPNPGHGVEEVYIFINGIERTLQQALDDDFFKNCDLTGGEYTSSIDFGHKGENVLVNVNGSIKNLQEAINDKSLVSLDNEGNSPEEYGEGILLGHYASELVIDVSGVEKTVQGAVNDGDFVCEEVVEPPVTGGKECFYDCSNPLDSQGINCYACRTYGVASYGYMTEGYMYLGGQKYQTWTVGNFWDLCRQSHLRDHCSCMVKKLVKDIGGYRYSGGDYKDHIAGPHHVFEICREPI